MINLEICYLSNTNYFDIPFSIFPKHMLGAKKIHLSKLFEFFVCSTLGNITFRNNLTGRFGHIFC